MSSKKRGCPYKVCLTGSPLMPFNNNNDDDSSSSQKKQHRQIVEINDTMTMEDLACIALDFLQPSGKTISTSTATSGSSKNLIMKLLSGIPPKPDILEWQQGKEGDPNDPKLAREVIPHMSKIECCLFMSDKTETKHESTRSSPVDDDKRAANDVEGSHSDSRKKQKISKGGRATAAAAAAAAAAADIVDLTSENEDEENNDTSCTEDDEALARRLQEEEFAQSSRPRAATPSYQASQTSSSGSSLLDDARDPTTVTSASEPWIFQRGPAPYCHETVLGKWLVFRNQYQIAATWNEIAMAVQSGNLQAALCKVATHSNACNNKSYVICVYTSEARQNAVGRLLIQMVRHDLFYKTDQATMMGIYTPANGGSDTKVSSAALYWNHGRPSSEKTVLPLMSPKASLQQAEEAATAEGPTHLSLDFDGKFVAVVGLQHEYYKAGCSNPPLQAGTTSVVLTREPANPYDAHAIQVLLASSPDDQNEASPIKVGYVKSKEAKLLAPWLDRGLLQISQAKVFSMSTDTEITVELQGKACPQAREVLACF